MVQGEKDPLTGGNRDAVFMAQEDAAQMGLQEGDAVTLTSPVGEMAGKVHLVPIKPKNVQVFWPEGNVLIQAGACDPVCHIPDYNTFVEVRRVTSEV
jgi:anaerobic selenocysteine-containing dehydrogenase